MFNRFLVRIINSKRIFFSISSFFVAVLLNDRQYPAASGSTKNEASVKAAYRALYDLSLNAESVHEVSQKKKE